MRSNIGCIVLGILFSLKAIASVDIPIGGKNVRCLTLGDSATAQSLYAKMPHIKEKIPLFFGELAAIAPSHTIAPDIWDLIPVNIQSLYQRGSDGTREERTVEI
jgi:hypothetical protein